jgi:hypothetical protein
LRVIDHGRLNDDFFGFFGFENIDKGNIIIE